MSRLPGPVLSPWETSTLTPLSVSSPKPTLNVSRVDKPTARATTKPSSQLPSHPVPQKPSAAYFIHRKMALGETQPAWTWTETSWSPNPKSSRMAGSRRSSYIFKWALSTLPGGWGMKKQRHPKTVHSAWYLTASRADCPTP